MKRLALLLMLFLLFVVVSLDAAPGLRVVELESWDFPRLDEIYMIDTYPYAAFEKAIACEIPLDLPPGVHTWKLVVHTATGDNTYVLEAAHLVADTNGDGIVDIKDLVLLIKAFGSYQSHPRWSPNSDVNGDDKVDIKDLVLLIKNYGKTCPH